MDEATIQQFDALPLKDIVELHDKLTQAYERRWDDFQQARGELREAKQVLTEFRDRYGPILKVVAKRLPR